MAWCRVPHVSALSLLWWSRLCCGAPCFALAGYCLAPDGLNSTVPTLTCLPHRGETPITLWVCWFQTRRPITRCSGVMGRIRSCPPLNRNETIRPRDRVRSRTFQDRPLNRKTLNNRPTLPTIPQRTTHHPEHAIERGKHDSQPSPKENDARIDDKPLHHEAHGASAGATTTR